MSAFGAFKKKGKFFEKSDIHLGGREVAEDVAHPVEELEGGGEDAQPVVEELHQEVEEDHQEGPGVVDQVCRTDQLSLSEKINSDYGNLEREQQPQQD